MNTENTTERATTPLLRLANKIVRSVFVALKVKAGNDQETAQSERNPPSNKRSGKKTKLTVKYTYSTKKTYRRTSAQLLSQEAATQLPILIKI